MNKKDFCQILNCALFSFDGINENEMLFQYGLNPKFIKAGIKLCDYLKSLNFEHRAERRIK